MNKGTLLRVLPVYRNDQTVLVEKQNVKDIMKGVIYAHDVFKPDYDQIAKFFTGGSVRDICERIWDFCKRNIPYNIESDKLQSVRSPSAILAMIGGGDCKNYAQFAGGVLDAINRLTGSRIKWFYRFASYEIFDSTPEHVFVVVNDNGTEIWIDPVLKSFDSRRPYPMYHIDKSANKNTMALVMIKGVPKVQKVSGTNGFTNVNIVKRSFPVALSGVSCICPPDIKRRVGAPIQASAAEHSSTGAGKIEVVGSALVTVGIGLEAIPGVGTVAGAIVAAVGGVVALAGKLFGSNWHSNNEVRWMIQFYQYYVLGQGNVTSDNKVNEAYLQDALNWFYAVLGVPVYDRNTVCILASVYSANGKSSGTSIPEAAAGYLAYPQIKLLAAGLTLDQAYAGATNARQLKWYSDAAQAKPMPAGSWAGLPVAPQLVAAQASDSSMNSVATQSAMAVPATTGNTVTDFVSQNPLLVAVLVAAGIYVATEL